MGRRTAARLVALAAILSTAATASAKSRTRYIYRVSEVSAADKVKAPLPQIRAGLATGIAKTDGLTTELPAAAPDPEKNPKAFKRFLKRKRLRAFRVNLEVTRYEKSVETLDERGNKALTVSVALHLFGETIPDRTMAFAGNGSATIKMEVGKKVRKRDETVANHDAIEVAIDQAIAESLRKLAAKKKRRRRRKK